MYWACSFPSVVALPGISSDFGRSTFVDSLRFDRVSLQKEEIENVRGRNSCNYHVS